MPIHFWKSTLPILTAWICVPQAFGQASQNGPAKTPVYDGVREWMDGANVPPIPGASFSAIVELEVVQTLLDGTKITHRTTNRIARDFRGRTHNEGRQWMDSGDAKDAKLLYSIIYDPATKTRFYLYPETKLARQVEIKPPAANPPANNSMKPTTQKEDLGTDFIDGIRVRGFRTTVTYPVASFGNDRPVAMSHEYWFSDELRINLLVKRNDPRTGTQVLKLSDLRREEPDVALFDVPVDYKLVNETPPRGTNP